MQNGQFKHCPYCTEQIRASAIKCRYCGEWLEKPLEAAVETVAPPEQPAEENSGIEPALVGSTATSDSDAEPVDDSSDLYPVCPVGDSGSLEKRNYFVRHWRGELPLAKSYWVNGLAVNILVMVLLASIQSAWQYSNLRLLAAGAILFYVLSFALWFWQIVGAWRSANHHVACGGIPGWAALAKVSIVLGMISVLHVGSTSILPQTVEFWNILCGDTGIPAYQIQVTSNGTEVEFAGGLRAGSARSMEQVIQTSPNVKVLRLTSIGGRVAEAVKMAELIRGRSLDTYVATQCLSAATFVFMAGKQRVLAEGAQLGFHAASFPGLTAEQIRPLQGPTRQIMVSAGVSEEFIKRAESTPNDNMWFPTVEELKAANVITKEDAPSKTFASDMLKWATYMQESTNSSKLELDLTGHDEIDRLINAFAAFGSARKKTLLKTEADLDRIGEVDVYSEQTLKDQIRIQEAITKQSKRTAILADSRLEAYLTITQFTNELATMNLNDSKAKGLLKGILRGAGSLTSQADRLLSLRAQAELAKKRFLDFMLEAFSRYTLSTSGISFDTSSDSKRYNSLGQAIMASEKALTEFQTDAMKLVDKSREQLLELSR